MKIRLATLTASVLVACLSAGAAGWFGLGVALSRVQERGLSDIALSGDRLSGHLLRYRETVVLLSDHPELAALLTGRAPGPGPAAKLLQEVADKTGAAGLQLIAPGNRILAKAGAIPPPDAVIDPIFRALGGALGSGHLVTAGGHRQFVYAAPVFAGSGPAIGALAIAVDANAIEWNWPSDPNAVFFHDQAGTIFVSNRSELTLQSAVAGQGPFAGARRIAVGGPVLHLLDAGPYLPSYAVHMSRDMPVIGLTAGILIDAAPAVRGAFWQAMGVLGLVLALAAIAMLIAERRRALIDRLAREEEAKHELEERVRDRTAELSDANRDLRREISERHEAEEALRRAQTELVQAGKLSALGKMSAGISHELNQPLMAIRSFAENAETFLSRGQSEPAAENLGRISELARRMGRIIKNLRAFSRQESEALTDVDLVAVVDAVVELSAGRIAAEAVELAWTAPEIPVIVRGGEVRLQQVVTNLVSNALDAMDGREAKALEIALAVDPGRAVLSVRDTGPGIAEPDKIFDPFYSTKATGAATGMGLGLSISYGLVQSFGGEIRGRNHADGGAVFSVDLALAGAEAAA